MRFRIVGRQSSHGLREQAQPVGKSYSTTQFFPNLMVNLCHDFSAYLGGRVFQFTSASLQRSSANLVFQNSKRLASGYDWSGTHTRLTPNRLLVATAV